MSFTASDTSLKYNLGTQG